MFLATKQTYLGFKWRRSIDFVLTTADCSYSKIIPKNKLQHLWTMTRLFTIKWQTFFLFNLLSFNILMSFYQGRCSLKFNNIYKWLLYNIYQWLSASQFEEITKFSRNKLILGTYQAGNSVKETSSNA